MTLTLYINESDEKSVPKVLKEGYEIEYELLEPSNIEAPVFRLRTNTNIIDYNYCYVPEFKRYYFLSLPTKIVQGLYEVIAISIDELQTWWDSIKNLECILERQQYEYNWYLPDPYIEKLEDNFTVIKSIQSEATLSNCVTLVTLVGAAPSEEPEPEEPEETENEETETQSLEGETE